MIDCTGIMCLHEKNGKCTADKIEIVNFEYWDEEEKEYKDFQRCGTFKKDPNWISK